MEAAQPRAETMRGPARFTFLQKPVAAIGFIALADLLFYFHPAGTTAGFYCLSLLAFVLIVRPEILRRRDASIAAAAAGVCALVLGYDPSLLSFTLFWLAITLAVLLPRTARFDDGWRWAERLAWHLLRAPVAPVADQRRLSRVSARRPIGLLRAVPVLALPVLGSILFLFLFAQANPVIGNAFSEVDLDSVFGGLSFVRILLWLAALIMVWSLLRPRPIAMFARIEAEEPGFAIPGGGTASVTLSLIAFNAIFALENGLDIAFLWNGARLPEGMTLAEYAHRGAYPLIATALLAGLFVLLTLRPGSELAASAAVRKLVYVWIAQNIFLVASTMLRTFAYVDAYSLTRLRIAAFIWMALVAIGLALICYRIWRRKSGAWLINANLAVALIALSICSVVDLGRMAAAWNVRHGREAGGRGAHLDICYLEKLGASALLPMIEIEGRTRSPLLKERIGQVRIAAQKNLAARQSHWRGWTLRGALRLKAAKEQVAKRRLPSAYPVWRYCNRMDPRRPLTAAPRR